MNFEEYICYVCNQFRGFAGTALPNGFGWAEETDKDGFTKGWPCWGGAKGFILFYGLCLFYFVGFSAIYSSFVSIFGGLGWSRLKLF